MCSTTIKSTLNSPHQKKQLLESRLRAALWGFFSGDALAAPTHWYYGGFAQIKGDYGNMGITNYTKPKHQLRGSIMNKSNINGGGRGSFALDSKTNMSIIGDVINHGKRDYWAPQKSIHYHASLARGENTLEVQLARVLMKSIVANNGEFNADHFRTKYVEFMTTPCSHNDTYASTCHRMFFANLIFKELQPKDCPDNDYHNVDTIDGLVLPTIVALAKSAKTISASFSSTCSSDHLNEGEDDDRSRSLMLNDIGTSAAYCASVTRNSSELLFASKIWSRLIYSALNDDNDDNDRSDQSFTQSLNRCAKKFGMRRLPQIDAPNAMSACYLSQSIPPLVDMIAKYTNKQRQNNDDSNIFVWQALIENANTGGENVHRGSILGAVLGAREVPVPVVDDNQQGSSSNNEERTQSIFNRLKHGLFHEESISKEIDDFVRAVID